jgi:signal transduction histidine kinase
LTSEGRKERWLFGDAAALLCHYMALSSATPPPAEISIARWPIFGNRSAAYACALGLTAIAFLVRWDLNSVLGNSSRTIFFVSAAALSAFLFGRGPGIFSTFLGLMVSAYCFSSPRYTFHLLTKSQTVSLLSAGIQGVLISFCAGYLHRALRLRAESEQEARNLYEAERRAHEAADELNRTKDYFLAVLSHELRGPLSAISYCVSDRLKDTTTPLEVREDFALIERNARMQSRLIDDLLDLTRLTRGKLEIELRPLDVHLLLAEAVRTCGVDGQPPRPTPTLHLHARETRVQGDRDRLLQVFWNILRNATKFTPEDGRIDVETFDTAAGCIGIRIRDTGVGVTAETLERIFHPFEQAGRETNRKHGGLGLGLAIARGLVELHDGALVGESAGLGHGTTFTVDLPVISRNVPPGASRRSGIERGRSGIGRPPVGVA